MEYIITVYVIAGMIVAGGMFSIFKSVGDRTSFSDFLTCIAIWPVVLVLVITTLVFRK